MNRLLAATCLTPVALLAASPAAAETVISTAVTTPVATGTANDDIRISSTGSIRPTVSGAAVTINSNHDARNEGTIAFAGVNDATGILANANVTADITNTGTITLDETFTPTDSDNDGDLDGPFAQGTGRFGIRVLGPGTFTGNIANSVTIAHDLGKSRVEAIGLEIKVQLGQYPPLDQVPDVLFICNAQFHVVPYPKSMSGAGPLQTGRLRCRS